MSTKTNDKDNRLHDAIAEMPVMELVELIEAAEQKFGVSAAAPAFSASQPQQTNTHPAIISLIHRFVKLLRIIKNEKEKIVRESNREVQLALLQNIELKNARLIRQFPVCVYLKDGSNSKNVVKAIHNFLDALDAEILEAEPPKISSFWQKFTGFFRDKKTSDEIKDALEKGKKSLEIQQIKRPQSEVLLNEAKAAAQLLQALGEENQTSIVILSGLLVCVLVDQYGKKHQRVLTLTDEQMLFLNNNPSLIKEPEELLELIDSSTGLPDASAG